jgi:DNA-binding MarR family transcriptional regulator
MARKLPTEAPPRGASEVSSPGAQVAEGPPQGSSAAESPERRPADPGASDRSSLAAELSLREPFARLEQEVFLSILRTADHLDQGLAELLKPFGLTPTQYNVLRILRGAGARGLACRQLSERMLTHDPDVTRLLDRLERRGLLARRRPSQDRRVILTGITAEGLRLLEQLDAPVADLHRRQLAHLDEEQLRSLLALLERVRG